MFTNPTNKEMKEEIANAKEKNEKVSTITLNSIGFADRDKADACATIENIKAEKAKLNIRYIVGMASRKSSRAGINFIVKQVLYIDGVPEKKRESANPTKTLMIWGVKGRECDAQLEKWQTLCDMENNEGHYIIVSKATGEMAENGFDFQLRHYIKLNEVDVSKLSVEDLIPDKEPITEAELD